MGMVVIVAMLCYLMIMRNIRALEKIYFDSQNNVTIPAVSDADWKRRVKIIVKNALKGEDE
jgi:hypothetical protein